MESEDEANRAVFYLNFFSRENQGHLGRKEQLGTLDQKALLGTLARLGCQGSLAPR